MSAATADPDVTVVVPTRNRRGLLQDCLASVLAQEAVPFELVVVDDASTDDTPSWLETVRDPRVRTVRLPVPGERSSARNRGMAEARGRFVMFLDDDDLLWPRALQVLARALDEHPSAVAAVGARWTRFAGESYERRDAHPRVSRVREILDELLLGWSAVSGQSLYRSALVREVGGFDPDLTCCEDRDLWLRLATRGPIVLRPEIVMTYYLRPRSEHLRELRALRESVARRAIDRLPPQRQRHAQRLRRTNQLLDEAEDALSAGRFRSGLVSAMRAGLSTPGIFASPLIGEWVFRRLAGRVARRLRPPASASPPTDRSA